VESGRIGFLFGIFHFLISPPLSSFYREWEPESRKNNASKRNESRMKLRTIIRGAISPKSVVCSGNGLAFAQNMMYRHTVTVYDRNFRLVKTLPDTVNLAAYGIKGYSGTHKGSPVECAFTPDGRYAWVSNYQMYGKGFNKPGNDRVCAAPGTYDSSFLYRIDTETLRIDRIARAGAVPKYVAVTPDSERVLVTNWCSGDLVILDADSGKMLKRVPLGRMPRGIAVDEKTGTIYGGSKRGYVCGFVAARCRAESAPSLYFAGRSAPLRDAER
jgi:YVTN family beta-propeller protein